MRKGRPRTIKLRKKRKLRMGAAARGAANPKQRAAQRARQRRRRRG